MDKQLFYQLGLTKEEVTLYLHIAKHSVQTIQQIARQTGINRTTVYRYLSSLEEKGLIEWVIGERGRLVKSVPAENLKLYLLNKKTQLESIERGLPALLASIQTIRPSEKLETSVKYFTGERGIKQMIWNTLKTQEATRSYAPLNRREFISRKFEDEFEIEWAKRGLKDMVITSKDRISYIKEKLVPIYKKTLAIRLLPADKFTISSDVIIYNHTFAVMSLGKGNLVGVEIDNAEITNTQKIIFDLLWHTAEILSF